MIVDDQPIILFEVKTSDTVPSKSFNHFRKYMKVVECVQLVVDLQKEFDTQDGIKVRNLADFLANFDLLKYIKP